MANIFFQPEGEQIEVDRLCVPKAHSLASALAQGKIKYDSIIECRTRQDSETIVFDVEVELPQLPKYPINRIERIAVIFYSQDDRLPEVLALRSDFPCVPHLNLREKEFPRSLCLYEEQYRDLKGRWTAQRFIGRIRQWLALTARDELHQDDQPLEPFISGYVGHIVLPKNLLEMNNNSLRRLYLTARGRPEDELFLIAEHRKPSTDNSLAGISSVHYCPPQVHGLMFHSPRTLAEVFSFVKERGLNLITELRDRLKDWLKESLPDFNFLEKRLILIIVCPKKHGENAEPEAIETWAFITKDSFKEVGRKIGVWEQFKNHIAPLISVDETKIGEDIEVGLLNPSFHLTRKLAANLNGLSEIIDTKIAAIGIGALGSQVIMNLARSGTGRWELIDDDVLMPHNVTRHALCGSAVGFTKSTSVAVFANDLVHDNELFKGVPADIMEPKECEVEIIRSLTQANVILDMSASITVARHLALDIDSSARRISLFLNPTGEDLVLLAENGERSIKLDELEFQLYRAISCKDDLRDHFNPPDVRHRYGRSCRDVTTVLPQDTVALHAAIGARALIQIFQDSSPHITVWRSDSFGNVKRINLIVAATIRHRVNAWSIVIDENIISKLHHLRSGKLPKETGGVLIGSFDLDRKIVYIVDTIPSPPDSVEWPTLYIRGSQGLKKKVEEISKKTFDMLEYIGEWHSHSNGTSTAPSEDDVKVFTWLKDWMDRDGLPAVMMIIGDFDHASCFVDEISQTENLIPSINTI